jgi:hypothetical protein
LQDSKSGRKPPKDSNLLSRRREETTVKILCRGLAKSRQPSDLIEKQGGYGVTRVSSSGDCEPLDPHLVTRQPSDLTGVARGLNPRKQSEGPERCRDIEVSEFGISEVLWTRDRVNPR